MRAHHVAQIALGLQGTRGIIPTSELVASLVVAGIDACEDASLSLLTPGSALATVAATSPRVRRLEELQYTTTDTPALSTIAGEEIVASADLAQDERWSGWGPRAAADTGIRSLVCFRMFDQQAPLGVLSLASDKPHAFETDDIHVCLGIAALGSMALTAAMYAEQTDAAMESRNQIGQAQGIVMERFSIDASRALAVLKRMSSHSNRKLRDIAADIAATGNLPVDAGPAQDR